MTAAGKSRFLSNTAALTFSTGFTAFLTIIQVKILAAHLTMDTFGLFAALRGLSLFIAMLAANGLPQLLIRYLPLHESRGQTNRALALSGACLLLSLALFAVLAWLSVARGGFIFARLPLDDLTRELQFWFLATTAGVMLKLVVYGGFTGLRRMGVQTAIETVSLAAQVAWIYSAREGLTMVALFRILGTVSCGAVVLGLPWYVVSLVRNTRGNRGHHASSDYHGKQSYANYWLGATGLSVVALAFTDVDRYLLSQVLALEILSLFHVGSRVIRLCNRFLAIPVLALQPEISRLDAEGRDEVAAFSARIFMKFNVAVSMFVMVAVAVFATEIITAIATEGYLGARALLLIMAISLPLTSLTAPLTAVMKSLDRVRDAFYCDLLYALSYLPLLLMMGGRMGAVGAGVAHVLACALQLALAIRLSRLRLDRHALYIPAAKAATCAVAVMVPALVIGIAGNGTILVATKVVAGIASLWGFKRLAFAWSIARAEERERLMSMLQTGGLGRISRWLLR